MPAAISSDNALLGTTGLPTLRAARPTARQTVTAAPGETAAGVCQTPFAAQDRVLLVDDDPMIRDMVLDFLADGRTEIVSASCLTAARERLADRPSVDLVIADVQLPDGRGIDLMRWARETDEEAPFILITGHGDLDTAVEALNLGAHSFLKKPFEMKELHRLVHEALAVRRCQRTEERFHQYVTHTNRLLRQEVTDALAEHQKLLFGCLTCLAQSIDARDPCTREHSASVALLAKRTAAALDLDGAQQETAWIAGMLHDIGKLAVPEHILLKPATLTRKEYAAIQVHPLKSEEILAPLPGLDACKAAVRAHHERYDGRGYPDRLTEEEIPLIARILSVCDTWDAMTADRPYRKALPAARAERMLRCETGKQLDPDVLDVFLGQVDQTRPSTGESPSGASFAPAGAVLPAEERP